jgi:hypothetical protein
METFEIVAQVRMMVSSENQTAAEDAATALLNEVVIDIEHIEVVA